MKLRRAVAAALLPVGVVGTMLSLYLVSPIPVQTLRHAAFDQFQRWHPRPYVEAPVTIVDVDEESLARLGQWPWPRARLGELVGRLRAGGAAAIGFDVVFAEPDRTAPATMAAQWGLQGAQAARIAALPDPDQRFAQSIRDAGVVLGVTVERGGAAAPADIGTHRIVTRGEGALASLPVFDSATLPIPVLREAAGGLGSISFRPDPDGIVRRIPMLVRLSDAVVPSMSAELLRVAQGAGNYLATGIPERPGLHSLRIGRHTVPTTEHGEAWIHYGLPDPRRHLPAWRVLDGSAPASALRDRLVLVGTSAKGLLDLRLNALGAVMPGVEAHAQLLEQIHAGHFLERPPWAASIEVGAIALGGLTIGVLALGTGPLVSALAALAAIAAVSTASWWAFVTGRLLVDPTLPAITLLLAFVAGSVVRHRRSDLRHRWIRHAFSRYVSPNLVAHLVENPRQLVLGGRRQQCSFIFTDLAGFTSLMERIDPADAVTLLNDYLDGMIRIVFRHEGTLDRIVGDALAVVFSAPVEQPDHRRRALACALDLHRFAQAHVEALAREGVDFGRTRIGVHAGEVIVGNFGGSTIFDYRALGDPVNTAARLETLNKQLGTLVCVSGVIRDDSPEIPMRAVGRVVLKGRTQALPVYEPLLDAEGRPRTGPDRDYDDAYARMAAGDPGARAAFERLAAQRPGDGLVSWQLARMRDGEVGDRIVMTEK